MTTSHDIEDPPVVLDREITLSSPLFDELPEAIVGLDVEVRVICWNASAEKFYKRRKCEVVGKRLKDLLASQDDLASVREAVYQSMSASRWKGVLPSFREDGSFGGVQAVGMPLKNSRGQVEGCVLIVDVAGSRSNEPQPLRGMRGRFGDIFENSVVGIFQTTSSGELLAINSTMARILGYESPEDLTKTVKSAYDLHVEPERRDEFLRIAEEQGTGGIVECQLYSKDRQKIWVQASARAILGQSGEVSFYEGTLQEMTERKVLEEQLAQAQKMEAIGRLAGGVAHDFNNLLTAINGYGQLLLNRLSESDPCYGYATEILRATNKATALTSDLLTFSKKPPGKVQTLDLNGVVADLENSLSRVVGESVTISTNLSSALGTVRGDRTQIERVLMNLTVNARDAMPEGGRILITTENIRVETKQAARHPGIPPGPYVLLTVADTGMGMQKETLSHIFEPFFSTKGKGKGMGLGLSTAYAIVQQYSGYVTVDSHPGTGTTFRLYFPGCSGNTGQLSIPGSEIPPPRGDETILLVEDEATVRAYTGIVLREQGYTVLEVGNGEEALETIADYNQKIDLVLTDVVMPKMGGKELSDRMRASWPDIKVLFYSGYTGDSLNGKISAGDRQVCLQKPFTKAELAQFVRSALDSDS